MIALALHGDWSLVGHVGAVHFSPRGTETQEVLFQLATTKSPTWSPAPPAQPETANQIKTGTVQTKTALCTLMERREEAFCKITYRTVRCCTSGLFLNPPSIKHDGNMISWVSDPENGDLWFAFFKELCHSQGFLLMSLQSHAPVWARGVYSGFTRHTSAPPFYVRHSIFLFDKR